MTFDKRKEFAGNGKIAIKHNIKHIHKTLYLAGKRDGREQDRAHQRVFAKKKQI